MEVYPSRLNKIALSNAGKTVFFQAGRNISQPVTTNYENRHLTAPFLFIGRAIWGWEGELLFPAHHEPGCCCGYGYGDYQADTAGNAPDKLGGNEVKVDNLEPFHFVTQK